LTCLVNFTVMRFVYTLILSLAVASCGGKLSEKERQALREEMNQREIRQVRDDEIVNHALELGRELRNDSTGSTITQMGAKYHRFTDQPDDDRLAELWDAYAAAWESGEDAGENVQRDYPDWVIYTYAEINDMDTALIVIRIPKKSIILSLESE